MDSATSGYIRSNISSDKTIRESFNTFEYKQMKILLEDLTTLFMKKYSFIKTIRLKYLILRFSSKIAEPVASHSKKFETPEVQFNCLGVNTRQTAIVLGNYHDQHLNSQFQNIKFTQNTKHFDALCCNKLITQLNRDGRLPDIRQTTSFKDLHPTAGKVILSGLGKEDAGYDSKNKFCKLKENSRIAAGVGTKVAQDEGHIEVYVEKMNDFSATSEGAHLASYCYQKFKHECDRKIPEVIINSYEDCCLNIKCEPLERDQWLWGRDCAETQNFTRDLASIPTNMMTPEVFTQQAVKTIADIPGLSMNILQEKIIIEKNMNGLVALSKGSCRRPIFLEIEYTGCKCSEEPAPVILIGQGVTSVNTSPVCKSNKAQTHIIGAATVLATMKMIAEQKKPINIRGLIPLCEISNGPCEKEIVEGMDETIVQVSDPRRFNVLAMMDALTYSRDRKPIAIVSLMNSPGLGYSDLRSIASATFCNNESLWETFKNAARHTGDLLHRYPLDAQYDNYIKGDCGHWKNASNVDPLSTDARILSKFVGDKIPWIHMELQYVNYNPHNIPYLRLDQIPGRPTRTITEGILQMLTKDRKK
ncbi:cytosol aminopeptidase-like [Daktulosphaira vitifoliae]|uniref:cytosol aminopeptidase-like n=1 Tax=Daktulosphaira vitifoliae TaxID=58002 RepID=UPI0021A9F198|nr:cytosol aminopeptidase-like [Daktulosphaira vitifoliae]XP_050530426.1 cytosol aminopeptidase-like [Daktulosphaira vitifoliae]